MHSESIMTIPPKTKMKVRNQPLSPVIPNLQENFKRRLPLAEYLLVLNPHEELRNRVAQVRAAFQETYQPAVMVGGKVHLTLLKFNQLALVEERIVQRLRTIAMGFCPFKVELKDFGSFPSHSIFINVTSKLPIRNLVKELKDIQRLMKLDKDNKPHFLDEPHILVARKLLPWQFEKGWLEYSNKSFTGRFIADGMLLLRRREGERAWQIVERLTFQNLPVATRQGELFA
jgi:2'-5' RNA ligase